MGGRPPCTIRPAWDAQVLQFRAAIWDPEGAGANGKIKVARAPFRSGDERRLGRDGDQRRPSGGCGILGKGCDQGRSGRLQRAPRRDAGKKRTASRPEIPNLGGTGRGTPPMDINAQGGNVVGFSNPAPGAGDPEGEFPFARARSNWTHGAGQRPNDLKALRG